MEYGIIWYFNNSENNLNTWKIILGKNKSCWNLLSSEKLDFLFKYIL